jgi:hypothetical protein
MEPETNQHTHSDVEVRALTVFFIGETLIEPGQIIRVSRMRASYLRFLQLVELI